MASRKDKRPLNSETRGMRQTPEASAIRILGVDPGLNVTGYGVIEVRGRDMHVVDAGIIRSTQGHPLAERVEEIHRGVAEVLDLFRPLAMSLEELYSHYERPQTAILMGHARGVICLAASQRGVSVHHYAATHIKKILTGSGRAPKSQMQTSIQRELRLPQLPDPPDIADALASAICHAFDQRRSAIATPHVG